MLKKDWLALVIIGIILGARVYFIINLEKPFHNGDQIRISTKVHSEPVRYENTQYLKLEGLKVYLPLYPEISYGDLIVVEGKVNLDKLEKPKLISNSVSQGNIYAFRRKLLDFYDNSLPTPNSSLIKGMVIGSKSGISKDFWDELKNSGTAHVVVASGMNVTLVAGFLINFLTIFFKRRYALILTFVGVWMYAILSGFDAPIVRAAIMGTIAFTAQELGKLDVSLRALTLSALVMIFINPMYISDVGFLLSFFATLGLMLFEPKINKKLKRLPSIIRVDLSTTLAAQIGVFPILIYSFGRFNILSPLANVLILWTVVPTTIIGMVGGLVGLIVPIVGKAILFTSYPLTSWFIGIVRIFG
jgi:competence protein ComEC